MFKFLKAIVAFFPNLVSHYNAKPPEQSSEIITGLVAGVGYILANYHIIDPTQWDLWGKGLVAYAAGRVLSKGLAPHPGVPG